MTQAISFSCKGESHQDTNKPCQDFSLAVDNERFSVAIVCDGHGGDRYFRSDIGSRFAAQVTLEAVTAFVENVNEGVFVGRTYTGVSPATDIADEKIDRAFRQLFSSIIYNWNQRIEAHAKAVPLWCWERSHVPQKYLDEFVANSADSEKSVEKQYGCTLMVYVQTSTYWFGFHIGDGKCLSFQESPVWSEPIPWDEKCFLNKTTSLCDTSCIDEFRYCYCGDGTFPMAVVLGSDGLDDSFGPNENLVNFYIQLLKMLAKEGIEATEASLQETLPQLSKIGSKDDMSVACVFNLEKVKTNIDIFIRYQVDMVKDQLAEIENRIQKLITQSESLSTFADEKSHIDYEYSLQELDKARSQRIKLVRKYNILAEELSDGVIPLYIIQEE